MAVIKKHTLSSGTKKDFYLGHGIGRRKSSVARVYVKKGTGNIKINHRTFESYFTKKNHRFVISRPLSLLGVNEQFDININVKGGGVSGQAGAISLGIAKAMLKINEGSRSILKKAKLLTRDSRVVERKKYGLRGARRSFQFSKR